MISCKSGPQSWQNFARGCLTPEWASRHLFWKDISLYYSVVPRPTLPSLIGRKGSSPLRSWNCHRPIHVIMHVQPGAMKMVLWRHWMHVTHVHPVTSENQYRYTRLYVYWKERVTLILFVKVLAHGRHPFSNHDNKHTFCNDGLYFGHVSFLSGFFEICRRGRPRLRLLSVPVGSPAKKKVMHAVFVEVEPQCGNV